MLKYKRIGVTVKSGLDDKNDVVQTVIGILKKAGAEVFFDALRKEDVPSAKGMAAYNQGGIDLLVVIGGDGTILRAIRELHDFSIPVLSVNRGTVGFMAETNLDEAEELLPKLLEGKGTIDERNMLMVKAFRDGEEVLSGIALNEVVIAQGTIARLVDLETYVNGEQLTRYHADGLIVATPTGSTAYSLAAGGPIVHPAQSALILTPINPHSFSQKPVIIAGDSVVETVVMTRESKFSDAEVFLTLDGQVSVALKHADRVEAKMYTDTVKFLRRSEDTFFSTLRQKLKWGERTED